MAARLVLEVSLKAAEDLDKEINTISHSLTKEFLQDEPSFLQRMEEFRSKTQNEIHQYLTGNSDALSGDVKKVADINFKTKSMILHSTAEEHIREFYKKTALNVKAQSSSELYSSSLNTEELGKTHLMNLNKILNKST
jgi:hypothetical protein